MVKAGERVWNLQKTINVREGFDRRDDRFPDVWFEPLGSGQKKLYLTEYNGTKRLSKDNVCKLLDDYYEERGWEVGRGIPTRDKLIDLGMGNVVADFEQMGLPLG